MTFTYCTHETDSMIDDVSQSCLWLVEIFKHYKKSCVWQHVISLSLIHSLTNKLENQHVNLWGTGYKDHATWAGMIMIIKLGPGNEEQMSVNTPYQTVEPTAFRNATDFPRKSQIFRKTVQKVIISEEKKGFWSMVTKCSKVQGSEKWGVISSEVKWSEEK